MISKKSLRLHNFLEKNQKPALFSLFFVFTLIFCLISLVNHYHFRTYALDLGMYNQAVNSFAHFKQAVFTLGIDGREVPFLGTHFSLITILYSPLYYVFGSYTLLIIQIAAILSGGLAIYKYSRDLFANDPVIPLVILFQFFSIWGIYSALAFDYHDNVLGAMLVPWLIWFIEKRKLFLSTIFLLLILFTKEVMAFWVLFILTGLMIKNRKIFKKEYLKFEIPAAIFCLVYGIVVTVVIMPGLQGSETNLQLTRYLHLGDSTGEIFQSLIQKPQHLISLLFGNISGNPDYNGIKAEFYIVTILSGGIFLFIRPVYLIMLIPVLCLKFLANDYALWGINYQYSIEFVPIISLALIDGLKKMERNRIVIVLLLALLTLGVNIKTLESRTSKWYNPRNAQFYRGKHYKSEFDLHEIYKALKFIDRNATVSGCSALVPHLADREKVYHFPVIKEADYIALLTKNTSAYPLSIDEYEARCNEYRLSELLEIVYDANDLLILKRKGNVVKNSWGVSQ